MNTRKVCAPAYLIWEKLSHDYGSRSRKTNIAQMQVAALSGNTAFNYYELCGPDGRGIFIKDKEKHFVPRSPYTEDDVKSVNRMLNNAMTDIALNASGYGLFVHNWKGIHSCQL